MAWSELGGKGVGNKLAETQFIHQDIILCTILSLYLYTSLNARLVLHSISHNNKLKHNGSTWAFGFLILSVDIMDTSDYRKSSRERDDYHLVFITANITARSS